MSDKEYEFLVDGYNIVSVENFKLEKRVAALESAQSTNGQPNKQDWSIKNFPKRDYTNTIAVLKELYKEQKNRHGESGDRWDNMKCLERLISKYENLAKG